MPHPWQIRNRSRPDQLPDYGDRQQSDLQRRHDATRYRLPARCSAGAPGQQTVSLRPPPNCASTARRVGRRRAHNDRAYIAADRPMQGR